MNNRAAAYASFAASMKNAPLIWHGVPALIYRHVFGSFSTTAGAPRVTATCRHIKASLIYAGLFALYTYKTLSWDIYATLCLLYIKSLSIQGLNIQDLI